LSTQAESDLARWPAPYDRGFRDRLARLHHPRIWHIDLSTPHPHAGSGGARRSNPSHPLDQAVSRGGRLDGLGRGRRLTELRSPAPPSARTSLSTGPQVLPQSLILHRAFRRGWSISALSLVIWLRLLM